MKELVQSKSNHVINESKASVPKGRGGGRRAVAAGRRVSSAKCGEPGQNEQVGKMSTAQVPKEIEPGEGGRGRSMVVVCQVADVR